MLFGLVKEEARDRYSAACNLIGRMDKVHPIVNEGDSWVYIAGEYVAKADVEIMNMEGFVMNIQESVLVVLGNKKATKAQLISVLEDVNNALNHVVVPSNNESSVDVGLYEWTEKSLCSVINRANAYVRDMRAAHKAEIEDLSHKRQVTSDELVKTRGELAKAEAYIDKVKENAGNNRGTHTGAKTNSNYAPANPINSQSKPAQDTHVCSCCGTKLDAAEESWCARKRSGANQYACRNCQKTTAARTA